MSRLVLGYIHGEGIRPAAYQVHWTLGQVERHGAEVYLFLVRSGDGEQPEDRIGVALHFHRTAESHGLTVVDAGDTPLARHELVGRALSRDEVIGTPLAAEVFALVDFIWEQDARIAEISLMDSSGVPGAGAGPAKLPARPSRRSERLASCALGLVLIGCGVMLVIRGAERASLPVRAVGVLMVIAGLAIVALNVRRLPPDGQK